MLKEVSLNGAPQLDGLDPDIQTHLATFFQTWQSGLEIEKVSLLTKESAQAAVGQLEEKLKLLESKARQAQALKQLLISSGE